MVRTETPRARCNNFPWKVAEIQQPNSLDAVLIVEGYLQQAIPVAACDGYGVWRLLQKSPCCERSAVVPLRSLLTGMSYTTCACAHPMADSARSAACFEERFQ
jgi:hypothetical protein